MTINVTGESHMLYKGAVFRWNSNDAAGNIYTNTLGVGVGNFRWANSQQWIVDLVWGATTNSKVRIQGQLLDWLGRK